jgi:hypothetical protein
MVICEWQVCKRYGKFMMFGADFRDMFACLVCEKMQKQDMVES